MPEYDNQPPFKIADDLGQLHVWQLVERKVTVMIGCVNCAHDARWTPQVLDRKLARLRGATLIRVAAKLRCSRCRSNFVRLWPG